jgi:drug/metabolite transporter (DMT)-like permease
MRTRDILTLCGISALWGSGWIFSPLFAEIASPYASAALTAAVACLALSLAWVVLRLFARSPKSVPLRQTILLGLVLPAAPVCLMIFAGRHGAGGWEILLYAMLPLLVAMADQSWTTPMIAAVGAVLVLFGSEIPFTPRVMAWALLGLAAVALQAYGLRLVARALHGYGWTAVTASLASQLGVAAVLLAACSWSFDAAPRIAPVGQWTATAVGALAWLALPGMALTWLLFYRLLAHGPLTPVQVAAGQWLQTLVAVLESAILLRARPSWQLLAALAALAVCAWMVLRPEQESVPASIVLRDTPR